MPDTTSKRPDTPLAATPEAKFSLTPKFDKVKKTQDANEKSGRVQPGINTKDGVAKAKPYEKKFIPASDKRSNASVVDGAGKTIKTSTSGSEKSREDLRRSYVKDSTDTMDRRNKNADYFNVTSGSKKNLSSSDKKSLVSLGKGKLS